MRLLTEAPDRLILDHRPLALAAGIGGGVAALGAAGAAGATGPAEPLIGTLALAATFLVTLERARLVLDAPDGTARIERIGVYGGWRTTRPLDALRGASLETTCDENGRPDCHRVLLHFDDAGPLPASSRFHAGPGPREAADAVNRWLRRTRWRSHRTGVFPP